MVKMVQTFHNSIQLDTESIFTIKLGGIYDNIILK